MVTVFTPTYNRKNSLKFLYESLKRQTDMDFQWIVVDDGSQDGTNQYIESLKGDAPFEIKYRYVENGGKMRAINIGVSISDGEFFFIVDSDDFVTNDAIEKIKKYGATLPKDMGGMAFRKMNRVDGVVTGKPFPQHIIDSTPLEIVYKRGIIGDKAEVFRTEILRKYPFRVYDGEKFIPEALVWMKIGTQHKIRYIDEGIYYFEYLPDGYTKNFTKLIKNNPKGFKEYYKEMLKYELPLTNKIKFLLRFLQAEFYILTGGTK